MPSPSEFLSNLDQSHFLFISNVCISGKKGHEDRVRTHRAAW
jgi:hypothetical protein